ncbi:lipoprotein insertase outer membrane protein LolB [Noviherbaspirillum sp.]|uniref:lipoprotein insertase outer membrane protein LolB n=1 Tax=Noviherbaspirillum sp. TaxID=1926288 RepID=UPI002D5F2AEE|nr:lipoprotein insertase outer membrane protein LolB [Noviherbaspirillum sp.]HZW20944.1 lipoprotein insertase outer membrane protein LolB [Noviherbaspirillum sp.]
MSLRHARALALALPLLLTACATVPPPAPGNAEAAAGRRFQETIDIGGRLSVRYFANGKEEALHGSFTWSQTPARTTVTLLSPLGQVMAVIDVDAEGATLRQAGQPVRSAPDVDALTADTLGWPLPVSGLRDWLQGFALDASGRRVAASPAHDQVTSRDGWRIHYVNWQDPENRPKRIDLARSTQHAGDVSLRIVIDSWQTR